VEACPHLHRTLARIRELGARAGIALNPATPPGALEYALDGADLILVMSVNPGFGGQKFIPTTYPKVRDIHGRIGTRAVEISIDGGVKLEHCKPLAAHGASVLVAGSAVFEAKDPGLEVRRMREAALSA
jgi:ribulose-phosphate 3-epimerase